MQRLCTAWETCGFGAALGLVVVENFNAYTSASLRTIRSRIGFPASRDTLEVDFHSTGYCSESPKTSCDSANSKPGIGLPAASWISTRTEPAAEVATLSSSRSPRKRNTRVINSPPSRGANSETNPSILNVYRLSLDVFPVK